MIRKARRERAGVAFAIYAASLAFLLAGVSRPATAATIVNKDGRSWVGSITGGQTPVSHTIKPAETLSGVCLEGCVLVLEGANDGAYRIERGERVSIEGGQVFYDGQEDPGGDAAARGRVPGTLAPRP